MGTSPILANIQSKEITADHQQKKSSGGHNSTPAHQRDNLASKAQAHSVRVNNSVTSKRDNKVDDQCNKQCSHQQNSGYARQDDSSEGKKVKRLMSVAYQMFTLTKRVVSTPVIWRIPQNLLIERRAKEIVAVVALTVSLRTNKNILALKEAAVEMSVEEQVVQTIAMTHFQSTRNCQKGET